MLTKSGEMSVLLATKPYSENSGQKSSSDNRDFKRLKSDIMCDHYKTRGHTMDICFKLVGYPGWYSSLKIKSHTKMAAHVQETGILGNSPLDFEIGSTSGANSSSSADTSVDIVVNNNMFK